MTERSVHLVGSIPAANAEMAMRQVLTRLGPHLRYVPDGETGERRNWINHIIESFRTHPDLRVTTDGDWSGYDRVLTFRVRKGRTLRGESLDFGHVANVAEHLPIFQRLRHEFGRPDLIFQVGIPGDLDMALFTLGALGAFRHRRAFTEATVREIDEISSLTANEVLFQIEVPAELIFVARMRNTRPLGLLANAVARHWPAGRSLEYIHPPLVVGEQPAPLDLAFYRPLRKLRLPDTTRFIAGLVQECQRIDEQRQVLATVEDQVGRPVDLAAMGSRIAATGADLLRWQVAAGVHSEHSVLRRTEVQGAAVRVGHDYSVITGPVEDHLGGAEPILAGDRLHDRHRIVPPRIRQIAERGPARQRAALSGTHVREVEPATATAFVLVVHPGQPADLGGEPVPHLGLHLLVPGADLFDIRTLPQCRLLIVHAFASYPHETATSEQDRQ